MAMLSCGAHSSSLHLHMLCHIICLSGELSQEARGGVPRRSWKENINRSEPPTLQVTVGVNSYSHFFSRINEESTQNSPRSTPEAILMHNLLIVCLGYTPRPAPGSGAGDAHH